jgi:endonuclease YncB( thermonuclease family)
VKPWIVAVSLLSLTGNAMAELCQPTRWVDGDTFSVSPTGKGDMVRVAGYDAPERGQPWSKVATAKLKELTQNGADCECRKRDKYGRAVCTVRVASETVAVPMLKNGLGCIDPRFEGEATPSDAKRAREALNETQRLGVGMWSDVKPMCGKEFRDAKKAHRGTRKRH